MTNTAAAIIARVMRRIEQQAYRAGQEQRYKDEARLWQLVGSLNVLQYQTSCFTGLLDLVEAA
jgi:hypothetical protein